jgi:hypothetical protein
LLNVVDLAPICVSSSCYQRGLDLYGGWYYCDDMEIVGMIKQRRVALGLSQPALAMRGGVSDAYITQLETRERINLSPLG